MENLCIEIWKDIEGFEGLYEVSNYCRVFSTKRNKLLKPLKNKGYDYYSLCKEGKHHPIFAHQLGAKAFIPNPNNYKIINHKDENPSNNLIWVNEDGSVDLDKTNIEWCNYSYNLSYGNAINKMLKNRKGKTSCKAVVQIIDNKIINEYVSIMDASRKTGIPSSGISKACNGIYKNSGGFIWKYK